MIPSPRPEHYRPRNSGLVLNLIGKGNSGTHHKLRKRCTYTKETYSLPSGCWDDYRNHGSWKHMMKLMLYLLDWLFIAIFQFATLNSQRVHHQGFLQGSLLEKNRDSCDGPRKLGFSTLKSHKPWGYTYIILGYFRECLSVLKTSLIVTS